MKKLFSLLCLMFACMGARATDLLWSDRLEMNLSSQPGWEDSDQYATASKIKNSWACSNIVAFSVGTNANVPVIPAGSYSVFIRALCNPGSGTGQRPGASVNGGGDILHADFDDLRTWKNLGVLSVPIDTTSVIFSLARTNPVATACGPAVTAPWPFTMFAVYLTTQTNVYITGLPEMLQVWNYPTSTNTTPAVDRNLLGNSSFEMPSPAGTWSLGVNAARYWSIDESFTTDQFQHGKSSMAVYFDRCDADMGAQVIRSKPVRVAANKAHTFSIYAKSSVANSTVRLQLFNPNTYPSGSGFPAMPTYDSLAKTITTSWARYSLTNVVLLEYPYAEYYPQITVTSTGGGTVWIDSVQLEEGDVATDYAPRDDFEIGVLNGHQGSLLYEDEEPDVNLVFHNGTGSSSSDTVNWRLYHKGFDLFASGSVVVGSLANSYYTNTITFPTLKCGFYRLEMEIQGKEQINVETDFTVMRRPLTEPFDNFKIGFHSTHWHFMMQLLKRAGFHHYRSLSPGAWFRPSFAEPSDGTFVYFDTEIDMIRQYGVEILGALDYNPSTMPAWMRRTYITLTNQVGSFQVGETVSSGTGTGIVTWISDVADPVPYPSLQVKSPSGTFPTGATLTGGTSGATAKMAARINNSPSSPVSSLANVVDVDEWRVFCNAMAAHYTYIDKWETQNEAGPGLPFFNGDAGMGFGALLDMYAIVGIKAAQPHDKIIINSGHQQDVYADLHWAAMPAWAKSNVWAHSFHFYPSILDGRGTTAKAWCDARGILYMNDETGYEDSSSPLTYGNNRFYRGIAIDKFQASETDTRKFMQVPRMIATNVVETVWPGAERYYYYQMHDTSNAGEELGSSGSHYTTMNHYGTFKPKASPMIFQNYILRQPLGLVKSNALYKVFSNIGPTNSVWLSMYTASPTNMVLNWSLTPSDVECYDMDGNLMTVPSGKVPFSRYPTFVRGLNGATLATLTNAVNAGTFANVADTTAPAVLITRCPVGTVTVQENAAGISVSWAGFDDVGTPWNNDPFALQYRYKFDSDAFTGWSGLCQLAPMVFSSGTHTLYVECRDKAGNVGTAQKTFTIL